MRVLVVDDNAKLSGFLVRVLVEQGFGADACAEGEQAVTMAMSGRYDLVILDWMLADVDGLSVCRRLRQGGVIAPVLMLTARGEPHERVLGLHAGADDYMVKPFDLEELLARVDALIRRMTGFANMTSSTIDVDRARREVRVDGVPLDLTMREYTVFVDLAFHAGTVVTPGALRARIWGTSFPGSNVVAVHIRRLRKKLGSAGSMIETVRGAGYRLATSRERRR